MTDTTVVIFIIGETILVVGTILIAWVKTKSQIAVLETLVAGLKSDHAKFEKRLEGISIHLAELTGSLKAKTK